MSQTVETLPGGTELVQDSRFLKLGVDAILLAAACPPAQRICDLGCGVGNVLISLADRQRDARLTGVEINPDSAAVCRQSVARNGLEGRVEVVTADLRSLPEALAPHGFDAVVCNPPYLRSGSVRPPAHPARQLELLDATAKPSQVTAAAQSLLTDGGLFLAVLAADRLDDYLSAMHQQGLTPAAVMRVRHRPTDSPVLALVCGERGGHRNFEESTLILTENGEFREILEGKPVCLHSTLWPHP